MGLPVTVSTLACVARQLSGYRGLTQTDGISDGLLAETTLI
tara:strand:+ start:153 stop:275 length:123 start_codon:yes stop_codon:yes gene_type:complete